MFNIGDTVLVPCHISPTGKHRPWNRTTAPPVGAPWLQGKIVSLLPDMVALTDSNAHPAVLGVDQMVEASHLQPWTHAGATAVAAHTMHAAAAATHAAVAGHASNGGWLIGPAPRFTVPGKTDARKPLAPIYSKSNDPKCCDRCHTHNDYAEPNMPGGMYRCYSCRQDPTRFML